MVATELKKRRYYNEGGRLVREQLMTYLITYFEAHDYAPSMDEMQTALHYTNGNLRHHLQQLRAEGRITYLDGHLTRTLRLATNKPRRWLEEEMDSYGLELLIGPSMSGRGWWVGVTRPDRLEWDTTTDTYEAALDAARDWWTEDAKHRTSTQEG